MSILNELKKRLKAKGVVVKEDVIDVKKLPTGIRPLDEILSGGIPIGVVTSFVGQPGSGKSALAAQVIAAAQSLHPDAIGLYIDTEHAITPERLSKLGCDMERTEILKLNLIEEIHKTLEEFFNLKAEADDKSLAVIVWDSIAFTRTERHLQAEKPEEVTGYLSRYTSFLLNKITPQIADKNVIFITISHFRQLIQMGPIQTSSSLPWISGKEIAGGEAYKYSAYLLINLKTKSQLNIKRYGFYGNEVMAFTIKNKNYPPKVEIPLVMSYEYGFSDIWSSYFLIDRYKLIKAAGAYKYFDGHQDKKFRISEVVYKYYHDEQFKQLFDENLKKAIQMLREEYKLYTVKHDPIIDTHGIVQGVERYVLDKGVEVVNGGDETSDSSQEITSGSEITEISD